MNQRMKKLNPRNISGFPGGTCGKESACQWRWPKSCAFDPRVGTIPWNRNGNLLRYSCLENPMDRGTWWVTVHGATKTQTQLSDWAHTAMVVVQSLSRVQLCNPRGCSMHWLYSKYKQKIITHHYSESFYTALWLSGQSPNPNSPAWHVSEVKTAQSCPTLCDPMGCSLPGSSVHGILQARILKWVAISFSKWHVRSFIIHLASLFSLIFKLHRGSAFSKFHKPGTPSHLQAFTRLVIIPSHLLQILP